MPFAPATIRVVFLLSITLIFHAFPAGAATERYSVDFPVLPDGLSDLLSSVSDSVNLRETPPETIGLLRRRMTNDVATFAQALKSRGYFKADISAELDTAATPAAIRFAIRPGPRFTYDRPELRLVPDNPAMQTRLKDILNRIDRGGLYSSSQVLDVETALLERLKELGYPSPAMRDRHVVADHATDTVSVRFELDSGQQAVFGPTVIEGLEAVRPDFVLGELTWTTGDRYDRRQVDATRERLVRTGLFRSVRLDADHDAKDRVTMRLTLLEAPQRNVRSGLWYYSDQGPGLGAGWTHRNLFGGSQELRLDTEISENLQSLQTALILPNFRQAEQSLSLASQYEHEKTDVYETTNLSVSGIIRRPFSDLNLGYGLSYRLAEVDKDDTRRFNLLSVPLTADYSSANHPLDPTSGLAVAVRLEPFAGIEDRSSSFVLWSLTGRHYLPLRRDNSVLLATRGRYAVLAGTSLDSIPEDMLLYAGGGGSVRGYAYQYAGDLDDEDKPLGGVSAVDFSAELRLRLNRDFGWVVFGDGGAAFASRNPANKDKLFWGLGTGVRYYTPIGPLRLDVAVPLTPRDGVDSPFQVYASLGQAF